eukprot:9436266-Pyramimonas_sp.AAC.1
MLRHFSAPEHFFAASAPPDAIGVEDVPSSDVLAPSGCRRPSLSPCAPTGAVQGLNGECGSTDVPLNGGASSQQREDVSIQEPCDVESNFCSSHHIQTLDQDRQKRLPVPSAGNSKFVISLCDAIPASPCPSLVTDSRPTYEGQAERSPEPLEDGAHGVLDPAPPPHLSPHPRL